MRLVLVGLVARAWPWLVVAVRLVWLRPVVMGQRRLAVAGLMRGVWAWLVVVGLVARAWPRLVVVWLVWLRLVLTG
ncbi:hypothetical protein GCM10017566_14610 [Amycolatopsis bartoniae]|uniref:Uncharacterized protein n=1 Tax=Amycolatopsis bartoniae TaxID=941986 RepID=A0A8H9MB53_9PSEU|nr:hypothetical protein GCM10017566_14610 [Amycolatopsis bartoniae]